MAAAETFTAASLEAMSAYAEGQALSVQGQFMEALESYQRGRGRPGVRSRLRRNGCRLRQSAAAG